MTYWTKFRSSFDRAFPGMPKDLGSGYQVEKLGENARRLFLLGIIGVGFSFVVMLIAPDLSESFDKSLSNNTFLLNLLVLLWFVNISLISYMTDQGRWDVGNGFLSSLILTTAVVMILWSFWISLTHSLSGWNGMFYMVIVFLVFSLLLFSLLELTLVLVMVAFGGFILMRFFVSDAAFDMEFFGVSGGILVVSSIVSRILYYSRLRNYLNWDNINQMNMTLKREVSMHLKTMDQLEKIRRNLDHTVNEQTRHLREANERLSEEVAERRYADKVRTILYRISTFVNGHHELSRVFDFIHSQLSTLMEVQNLYVVKYQPTTFAFDTIFEVSERGLPSSKSSNSGLCRLVYESGDPLLLDQDQIQKYAKNGLVDMEGIPIQSWLGIPLKMEKRVMGVLVVQSYSRVVTFDQTDLELLEYVSEHLALAMNRIEIEESLIAAKERAEESDRLKSSFLANMSHEIRTPMNAIVGFSELLGEPELSSDEQVYFSRQVIANSHYLLKIISDIIELSRIQSGDRVIKNKVLHVSALTDELLPELQGLQNNLDKNQIRLSVQVEGTANAESFICEPESFRRIMFCLVENALKFTHEGEVIVGMQKFDEQYIRFYVQDTGIGIDEEDLPAIFDFFRQGSLATRQLYRGTGLGLALAKALITAYGGRIWVESEPGLGSCFYFTLPSARIVPSIKIPESNNESAEDQIDRDQQISAG